MFKNTRVYEFAAIRGTDQKRGLFQPAAPVIPDKHGSGATTCSAGGCTDASFFSFGRQITRSKSNLERTRGGCLVLDIGVSL